MSSEVQKYPGSTIVVHFDGAKCIHSRHCVLEQPRVFRANVPGPWIFPDSASVEGITQVAHACPSGAITYERLDGGPQESVPAVNVVRIRENGPLAFRADVAIAGVARDPRHAVPMRRFEEQALLRRQPYGGGICRDRRAANPALRAARATQRTRGRERDRQRTAGDHRQSRDLQRHRPHRQPHTRELPLPVRRLEQQALLRRHPQEDRVPGRRRQQKLTSAGERQIRSLLRYVQACADPPIYTIRRIPGSAARE